MITIPHQIETKPFFYEELTPVRFTKSFFHWLTGAGRWAPYENNFASIAASELSVMSFNVWGAPQDSNSPIFNFNTRAKAIVDIIQNSDPDIICLQEVSVDWANYLLTNQYIQTNYFSTDATPDRMHLYFGLSQIILSKYPIVSASVYGLPGYEISTLLNANIDLGDQIISVNNVHLHSGKEHTAFRIAQLETIEALVSDQKQTGDKLILGDFNFGDSEDWAENKHISDHYDDVWSSTHPEDPGYTEDTYINKMRYLYKGKHKQERFDRIFLDKQPAPVLHTQNIRRIGMQAIDDEKMTWPSDHFGLLAKFKIKK